jgi:flagellar basal body-associated protein FliL
MADQHTIEKQVQSVAAKLDAEVNRVKKGQTITISVGVVLIIFIMGYFGFMSGYVKDALDPKGLALMAGTQITERIKEYRPQVEKAAKENAPILVDKMVSELFDVQVPKGREALEKAIMEEGDQNLEAMQEYLLDQFDIVMEAHQDNVQELVNLLKTSEGRDEFRKAVYDQINEAMADQEIEISLASYGDALADVENKLSTLSEKDEADFTSTEKATYDLLVIVRELANRSKLKITDLPVLSNIEKVVE